MAPDPVTAAATPVRIGSRGSALALVQARWVAGRLAEHGVATEVVVISTAGDERAPDTAWGEGAFVTAIERALLEGRVDAAVHSAKDVPTDEDPRLAIAAWTAREDPRDALVCRVRGTTLATLPPGSRVGTDSPRRTAFLRAVRPDLVIHPLSGNVDTRLRKLDAGESDALVLAVAGLTRLGRADRIDEVLPLEVAVPAPGQGALALQARADDSRTRDALARLEAPASRCAVEAERAFLAATGGGCRSPIGALGEVDGATLHLRIAAERAIELPGGERRRAGVVRVTADAPAGDNIALARDLADRVVRLRTRARVLVTRPADAAGPSLEALDAAGFDPVPVPIIETRAEPAGGALDTELADAARDGAWLVATSPTGVRVALDALDRLGIDPATVRWGVVADGSAAALRTRGVEPFLPSHAIGAALADELPVRDGDRVVLVRSDLADRGVAERLRARGAAVTDLVGYRTVEGPEASRAALDRALDDPIDAIALASGSAVRGLLALAPPDARARMLATPALCIGPATAGVAAALGFATVVETGGPSPADLVEATARTLASILPAVDQYEPHLPGGTA
jgi:hydroxymethylbilane synthase